MADPIEEERLRQDRLIAERLAAERDTDRARAEERLAGIGLGEIPLIKRAGTAPIWSSIGRGVKQVVTPLATAGAAISDVGTGVVNYLTGLEPTKLLPGNVKHLRQAYGLGETPPAVAPAAAKPTGEPPEVRMTSEMGSPSDVGVGGRPGGVAVADPDKASTFKWPQVDKKDLMPAEGQSIHDFAKKITPSQLKQFVDLNIEDDNFKGLGYVLHNDPETGKARIERIIDDPKNADPNAGLQKALSGILNSLGWSEGRLKERRFIGGVEQEVPGRKEALTAAANIMGEQSKAHGAKEARLMTIEQRREESENRLEMRQRELDQRKDAGEDTREALRIHRAETSFQKNLTKFGEDKDSGTFSIKKGLFEIGVNGLHGDREEVKREMMEFEGWMARAKASEKNKKATREDYLRKYRDKLSKSL